MNLFNAHARFQIDGNFGVATGIVELLVQLHLSTIDALPALPDTYPDGSIQGVCARAGFALDFEWKERKLQSLEVKSKAGNLCRLKYRDNQVDFESEIGQVYQLDGSLNLLRK